MAGISRIALALEVVHLFQAYTGNWRRRGNLAEISRKSRGNLAEIDKRVPQSSRNRKKSSAEFELRA